MLKKKSTTHRLNLSNSTKNTRYCMPLPIFPTLKRVMEKHFYRIAFIRWKKKVLEFRTIAVEFWAIEKRQHDLWWTNSILFRYSFIRLLNRIHCLPAIAITPWTTWRSFIRIRNEIHFWNRFHTLSNRIIDPMRERSPYIYRKHYNRNIWKYFILHTCPAAEITQQPIVGVFLLRVGRSKPD